MAISVKTKIASGIAVLFALLAIISALALLAINLLSDRTESLLTANYNSIRYCNQMLHAMDRLPSDTAALPAFEAALKRQEANVTERGEGAATLEVRRWFGRLRQAPGDRTAIDQINDRLYTISQLNQGALEAKNRRALETASQAKFWLSMLIALVLVIGFSLAFNLPGVVAAPVRQLTAGIREIAKGNYKTRIELSNPDDEFGEMAQAFNRMAGRLDDWENSSMARLLFEKSRVDSIINQMEDAVLGTDAEGRLLFINRAAEALYSLQPDAVVGRPVRDVAVGNDLLQTVLDGSARGPLKIVVGGKEQFFTLAHKAVRAGSASLGDVYTLRNVTHFQELDLSKTNLLATISHELKTPISSIKMSARLLRDDRVGGLNSEQQDMVSSIADDAERLLRLTGELLNMTQLETGNIQLRFQHLQPKTLVDEAVAALGVQAQARQVTIRQAVPEALPLVQADADKAALVLVNLLSNAVKYAPEGSAVDVALEQRRATVRFTVRDAGEGIDPQYQDRIFDRYFKVPGSINKSGTGLGLAIAREFIEAQGGTIGVESEPGNGSTFWFELPTAAVG